MKKPLSPEASAELNAVLRRACERMERRKRLGFATAEEANRLARAVADGDDEQVRGVG
jgi:hypothetical protein